MAVDPRAGTLARPVDLVDLNALAAAYHDRHPDPSDPVSDGVGRCRR
jgi:phosphoglucomutase